MKNRIGIVALILVVVLGSALVYADSGAINGLEFNPNSNTNYNNRGYDPEYYNHHNYNEDNTNWNEERINERRKNLKEDVKEGYITEAEEKEWEEHFDYMEEFHKENGYRGCSGMMGHRNNRNKDFNKENKEYNKGYGGQKSHGRRHRMGW